MDDDDVRDLRRRFHRLLLSVVLGFASVFGLLVAADELIHRVGHYGGHRSPDTFDLGTLVGMTVLLSAAWYALLHWFAHRNDRRLRALSMSARARVIRRNPGTSHVSR